MAPLLISGIASVASNLIDAWATRSQQAAAPNAAKFEGAMNRALGQGRALTVATPPPLTMDLASQLRAKLLAAPEVSSVMNAQDPSHPASFQVSTDGRLWMQPADGFPTEVSLAPDSQALAQSLAALTAGSAAVAFR